MAKESNKQPYVLLSLYDSMFKQRYNRPSNINRYREKWGMQDVIDSLGFDRAKKVLEYYFKTGKPGHPIQYFLFNFDKLNQVMVELEKDKDSRIKLLEETKQMVEEHEHRSSGN